MAISWQKITRIASYTLAVMSTVLIILFGAYVST